MILQPASERLDDYARQWNVAIEDIRQTETSVVAFGVRDHQPVVLKVARREGEEWRSGEVLAVFGGKGLVRAVEHPNGAVLLERLMPGNDLTVLSLSGRDEEAAGIIAEIIEQMASVRPLVPAAIAIADLASGFQQFRSNGDLMPTGMMQKAERLYLELCASQTDVRLLHGDLHHYNVLFDASLGWVAIDPWGLLGELEYEVGASLRNPIDAPELLASQSALVSRLKIYESRLAFDADRALRWAFAQTVLAALWPTEEAGGIDVRVPFTNAAAAMMSLI